MNPKILPAALLLAALPWMALAEEPAPPAAPAAAASVPQTPAAPEAAPAPEQSTAADTGPGTGPLADPSAPLPGKRGCNMKGKGPLGGPGMVGPGPMGGPGMGGPGAMGGPGCPHHCPMHADLSQRLDLIEARLAKIEAMLEGLIRR